MKRGRKKEQMNNLSRGGTESPRRGLNEAKEFRLIDLLPETMIRRLKEMKGK